jgi:hypothetical protein
MIMEILPQYGLCSPGNGLAQEGRLLLRRGPVSLFGESKADTVVQLIDCRCDSVVDIAFIIPAGAE